MTVCFGVKCPGCGQRNCPNPQIGEYFDGVDERPVAPAPTVSAREWLIKNYNQVKGIGGVVYSDFGQLIRTDALVELLEAYASSQSSKLEGVGQEAADRLWCSDLTDESPKEQWIAVAAAIIDELIAGRLKP